MIAHGIVRRSTGRRSDPLIEPEEVAESMRRLDRLDDAVFEDLYGVAAHDVRCAFVEWPRG